MPTLTPEPQHLRALARANVVRTARAELKGRIADGELDVATVIRENPWEARSMSIADLITSQRHWGASRCRRLLDSISLPENKQLGTLTSRQRDLLARSI